VGRLYKVRVCRGPSCGDEKHSSTLADEFRRILAERGLGDVEMQWQSCYGRCRNGPNVLVRETREQAAPRKFVLATQPLSRGGKATMYNHVTIADVGEIVSEHLAAGRPVRRLMERPPRQSDSGNSKKDGEE